MERRVKVLRISHTASEEQGRGRDRALARQCRLTVVVPWSETVEVSADTALEVRRLAARRRGDVNRHRYVRPRRLADQLSDVTPELVDVHEEPFGVATRQWLSAARRTGVPAVCYTAQNVDKRYPPPFAQYERAALEQVVGMYPCSRQAAAVARGKGFDGYLEVLPLGYDDDVFIPGRQSLDDECLVLGLVGRLVPEKGVVDAVTALAAVQTERPARLVVIGEGPEREPARRRAHDLGVEGRVDWVPWVTPEELSAWYRRMHVVLVPSRTTSRWAEQFGRVIVEARACGAVVVGYASGAIPEVVGTAGVVVPEGDVAALSAAVTTVTGDSGVFGDLRQLGLAISPEFTWTSIAARQVAFYEKALAEAGRPRPRSARSARERRAQAREEFGPTWPVRGESRPFALPVLRERPGLARPLAKAIDLALNR